MKGTVKWFSNEKGYGFITCADGEDYYFNVKNISGAVLPSNGDLVQFDSISGKKGAKANNVTITEKAAHTSNGKVDDRIDCPSCGKRIVPRIITDRGALDHSVCPFCGTWIEDFSLFRNFIAGVFKFFIKHPFISLVVGVIFFLVVSSNR